MSPSIRGSGAGSGSCGNPSVSLVEIHIYTSIPIHEIFVQDFVVVTASIFVLIAGNDGTVSAASAVRGIRFLQILRYLFQALCKAL